MDSVKTPRRLQYFQCTSFPPLGQPWFAGGDGGGWWPCRWEIHSELRARGVMEGADTQHVERVVVVTSSLLLLFLKIYSNIFSRIVVPSRALGLRLLHLRSREEVGKWGLIIAAIYIFQHMAPWLESLSSVCGLGLQAQSRRELRLTHPARRWDIPHLPSITLLFSQLNWGAQRTQNPVPAFRFTFPCSSYFQSNTDTLTQWSLRKYFWKVYERWLLLEVNKFLFILWDVTLVSYSSYLHCFSASPRLSKTNGVFQNMFRSVIKFSVYLSLEWRLGKRTGAANPYLRALLCLKRLIHKRTRGPGSPGPHSARSEVGNSTNWECGLQGIGKIPE